VISAIGYCRRRIAAALASDIRLAAASAQFSCLRSRADPGGRLAAAAFLYQPRQAAMSGDMLDARHWRSAWSTGDETPRCSWRAAHPMKRWPSLVVGAAQADDRPRIRPAVRCLLRSICRADRGHRSDHFAAISLPRGAERKRRWQDLDVDQLAGPPVPCLYTRAALITPGCGCSTPLAQVTR
jgi:hypothetical protein